MNFDSDTDILNNTRREPEGNVTKFVLPDTLLPFDGPIVAHIDKVEAGTVREWCNLVRSRVRAWEESQNSKKGGAEPAHQAADVGEAAEVRHAGSRERPVQSVIPATEEEMEKFLSDTADGVAAEIVSLERELATLKKRLDSLYIQRARLELALQAYISYGNDGGE